MSKPTGQDEAVTGPVQHRRPPWRWLVPAVLVLAVVVVLGVVHARSRHDPHAVATTGSESPRPTTSTPAPPAATVPVGLTFGGSLFNLSRTRVDQALDDVVALHMTWIRVDMSWASLQPRSSTAFDWAPMDAIVASARAHHLHVLGLLTYTPRWARAPGCTAFVCPPRHAGDFARFAAAVVSRYRDDVTTYQIWNEPNISLFWRHPDPAAYGQLLSTTVTAMRRADATLHILFGGLAFTNTSAGDIAPTRFAVDACAGRTCDVDAIGYDPFTYPALPSATAQPPNAWQLMADGSSSGIRSALARAGLGGLKIWVTEFGAPTDFPGSSGSRAVSEKQQAAIVTDGLRLARAGSAYVGAFFVDTWRDAKQRGAARDHFGIERYDGTHKPAFGALAAALKP